MYILSSTRAKAEARAQAEVEAQKTMVIEVKVLLSSMETFKTSPISLFLLVREEL